MHHTLCKWIPSIRKWCFYIHINTTKRINNLDKSGKVHTEIIVQRSIIEHTQCIHRNINTVNTGMSQLIRYTIGNRQGYKIITRCRHKQHLLGICIDRCNDIDIASRINDLTASGINTADIQTDNIIRICLFRCIIWRSGVICLNLHINTQKIQFSDLILDICITFHVLKYRQVSMIQNNRITTAVQQAVHKLCYTIFFLCLYRLTGTLFYLLDSSLCVLCIQIA